MTNQTFSNELTSTQSTAAPTTPTVRVGMAPIPHDFPFQICAVCAFPIPPHDLDGLEFEPCHASTCLATGQHVAKAGVA